MIRPTDFFETFRANSSGGFEGLETFFWKKKNSISFHFLCHLLSFSSSLLSALLISSLVLSLLFRPLLSLCLRVMLCVVLCGVSLWSWCCLVVVVCLVCVCVAARWKNGKTRVWVQKRHHVYILNVPRCAWWSCSVQQSWEALRRVTWFGLSPPSSPSSICICICICICKCVCVCVCVRVCARVNVYDLPQWFHVVATSYLYIYLKYLLSSIVKDATTFELEFCGRKQPTAQAHVPPHCVWLNFEHTKNSNRSKNNFRDDKLRIRICYLIPNSPEIVRIGFGGNGTESEKT